MYMVPWALVKSCLAPAVGIKLCASRPSMKASRRRNIMSEDTVCRSLLGAGLNKYGVCLLATALLGCPFVATTAALQETLELEQEMAFPAYEAVHWQTPVTTYNGSIYFTWVDNQMRTMIAKKTPDGKVTTSVILAKSDRDKNHSLPSVAVDKNGYIHVVYNMHQSRWQEGDIGWQYKVSDKPEDISSFTFVGDDPDRTIPGKYITYPAFTKDRNGNLYVTFRHRTHPDGNYGFDGSQGIGIAKYDVDSKRWRMLGGSDYKYGVKTFFWSDSSMHLENVKAGYQGYRPKLFFDRNNRMHVSWDVFIAPGEEASHIMYAYSDDGGKTFKKANGQTISSLPITPQNGDIVEQAPRGIYDTRTYVSVTPDGRPVVSFKDRSVDKSYYKIWNGDSWGRKKELPVDYPANFIVDSDGVMTAIDDRSFNRRLVSEEEPWTSYEMINHGESTVIDDEYLKQTDQLRFQTHIGDTVKVFTARFLKEDDCCSSPSPPTGLKAEAH
jgi:hypothetical protein